MQSKKKVKNTSEKRDGSITNKECSMNVLNDSPKPRNRIKPSDYLRVAKLYEQWNDLVWATTSCYIKLYFSFLAARLLLEKKLAINGFFEKETFSFAICSYFASAMAIFLKGLAFTADGTISSWLKTPFGQICYSINKSGIEDEIADDMVTQITEINENFKETFKKFGILNISEIISTFHKSITAAESESNSSSSGRAIEKIVFDLFWSISFTVPIFISWTKGRKLKNLMDEIEIEDE